MRCVEDDGRDQARVPVPGERITFSGTFFPESHTHAGVLTTDAQSDADGISFCFALTESCLDPECFAFDAADR